MEFAAASFTVWIPENISKHFQLELQLGAVNLEAKVKGFYVHRLPTWSNVLQILVVILLWRNILKINQCFSLVTEYIKTTFGWRAIELEFSNVDPDNTVIS